MRWVLGTCCVGQMLGYSGITMAGEPMSLDGLRAEALEIDRQVASFYRSKEFEVPETVDDAKFLRRTYLVTVGRIPTLEEARDFLESTSPDKRERLIRSLLHSSGYGSHMTNWIFDLIRLKDRNEGTSLEPYRYWLRNAVESNMPWDEFTRRIIASRGSGWNEDDAAVGYYVRDRGMPHDNLANSMRIFLGKRMECAQCHDDPFGKTKRIDFYRLAAFTEGVRPMNRGFVNPLMDEFRENGEEQTLEYRVARMLSENVFDLSVGGGGSGQIQLPSDYQYRDGRPGDILGAETPFGQTVRMSRNRQSDDGREKLAEWMTGRTGLQFPAVIANRMWRRIMGQGLVEPVDDFAPMESSHHPELFRYLAELMVKLNYDLKAFQQVLLMTRTYQFETNPDPSSIHGGDDFHGRRLQRLSAEQIWDSMVMLVKGDSELHSSQQLDDTIYLDGRPILVGIKTMTQLSEEIHALRDERGFRRYFKTLVALVHEHGSGDSAADVAMRMTAAGPARSGMIRASDLPSPAPRGHFLNVFGSSDREVVDAASRDANVGQVLSLMNGIVQREIIANEGAMLHQNLENIADVREQIRVLCLTILSRPPTELEMEWMLEAVESRGDAGLRNLAAAFIMSSEFLFLQ